VVVSVHVGGNALLLASGSVLGLLALTARGPLGLVRVCGARLHAVLDIVVGVLLALSPLVRAWRPGTVGIVAVELVAVAWLRMTMLTRYRIRINSPDAAHHSDVTPASISSPDDARGSEGAEPGPVLAAIRALGRTTAGARTLLPVARGTLDSGARRMGGRAGRLQRAWRRARR